MEAGLESFEEVMETVNGKVETECILLKNISGKQKSYFELLIKQKLLNEGYFLEQYVLPPTFKVDGFQLEANPKNADIKDLVRKEILSEIVMTISNECL